MELGQQTGPLYELARIYGATWSANAVPEPYFFAWSAGSRIGEQFGGQFGDLWNTVYVGHLTYANEDPGERAHVTLSLKGSSLNVDTDGLTATVRPVAIFDSLQIYNQNTRLQFIGYRLRRR